uniref:F5/8 type C domain-containing protein n=1 Tax=Panagrellus redivivus TaxID=6233 RepID=A0A7E4VHW9_PANRE
MIIQGTNIGRAPNGMLNDDSAPNFTSHQIGTAPTIVQLPQPYLIDNLNLALKSSNFLCSCNIEVSTDKRNWTQVWSKEMYPSHIKVKFEKQPVVFIKINGSYSKYSSLYKQRGCPTVTGGICGICSKN